eukprot:GFKZ01015438.1.p1 GENE.GFKZ01015438.1~~GFKZ01015438.1.p1  ORF type:complete len:456 (+),score=60.72 GFKZ01015438.1:113-1480(+)
MILRIRLPTGVMHRLNVPTATADLTTLIHSSDIAAPPFTLHSDPKFASAFNPQTARHGDIVYLNAPRLRQQPTPQSPLKPSQPSSQDPQPSPQDPQPSQSTDSHDAPAERPPLTPRCRHPPRGMCELCMPKEDARSRYESELRKWRGRGSSIAVMEALEALKPKITPQQEPHIPAAVVDSSAANVFQAYLATTAFSQQRLGICYGDVDPDTGETRVYAIYEPPQRGDADGYDLVEGDEQGDMTQRADTVAGLVGLERVGMVLSAKPRKCILSGRDVVVAARMMSALGEEARQRFVVLVVSTAETGETLFEAYQVSDLAVDLYEKGIFEDEKQQKVNGGKVLCKEDVVVEGKDTRKVHTEFFLLNVPIKSCDGWLRTSFAVENRELQPQGTHDVKKMMAESGIPLPRKLADFHALLFLSNTFDLNSDMPGLAAAVKGETDEIGEGYRLMIESLASS